MREEIIASCSGDSDACCSRLSQWRQVERDGAKTPTMRASPSSAIVSALQLLLQQDNSPLATLMGQHISGVEAGAVSGPADSIHLSARHIGTFPVCSLLHILHLTHQPLLSIYLLGGFFSPPTGAYKTCAPAAAKHTPAIYQRVILWALPHTDGYLAVLTQPRTICYCKCLSNTFRLFALTAH